MSSVEGLLPRKLSARFTNDFAYYTVKDRLPVTLTTVVDNLSRKQKHFTEKYGQEAGESVKSLIGSFSEMKSQLQTNKTFVLLDDQFPDQLMWNDRLMVPLHLENPLTDMEKECDDYLLLKVEESSWFNSSWLLTECYFYRKIFSNFLKNKYFCQYDPFKKQKRDILRNSSPALKALANFYLKKNHLTGEEKKELFSTLIQASLWANRWDLSLFSSDELHGAEEMMENLETYQKNILRDDTERIYNLLSSSDDARLSRVDVILDNSGLEVFSDMIMADFICTHFGVGVVIFHCKVMPWFVSDVTKSDWQWTLDWLASQEDPALKELSKRWRNFIAQKRWQLIGSSYWTLPDAFHTMSQVDSNLYNDLRSSQLIIFKGDLNYRKLAGDRRWPISKTSFETSLMGFEPSSLCAIRTLKSDILVGVDEETVARASEANKDWLVSGCYGVIQFQGKQEDN